MIMEASLSWRGESLDEDVSRTIFDLLFGQKFLESSKMLIG